MSSLVIKTLLLLTLCAVAVVGACAADSQTSSVRTQAVPVQTQSATSVPTQAVPVHTESNLSVSTQVISAPPPTSTTEKAMENPTPDSDSTALNTPERESHEVQDEPTISGPEDSGIQTDAPFDLGIPFVPSELAIEKGFMSPFGVVRQLKDRAEFGHSGIDIPLIEGAAILAVADGTVISILPAADKFPGNTVLLLISTGDREGEGWVFLMEHVELSPGIGREDSVTRGQQIATSVIPTGRGNTHMQLSYYFNEFQHSRKHRCWVDGLGETARAELDESFAKLFGDGRLAASWNNYAEGGRYPLRGLLDDPQYPGGPQPCYPQGTDVRVPAG